MIYVHPILMDELARLRQHELRRPAAGRSPERRRPSFGRPDERRTL